MTSFKPTIEQFEQAARILRAKEAQRQMRICQANLDAFADPCSVCGHVRKYSNVKIEVCRHFYDQLMLDPRITKTTHDARSFFLGYAIDIID